MYSLYLHCCWLKHGENYPCMHIAQSSLFSTNAYESTIQFSLVKLVHSLKTKFLSGQTIA